MTDQCERDIWDTYIQSHILDAKSPNVIWAGPHAGALPLATPIHVITASNPYEQKMVDEENLQRNHLLLQQLRTLKIEIKAVIAGSPSGDWQEASFAIAGLSRTQACEIASEYGQRGIFELTHEELLAIQNSNYQIMRRRPRVLV
jgi:hypothetical protein